MQPDSPLPPNPNPPTEPSILDEMVSLTSMFNPETIWHEEETLDDMDAQEAQQAANDTAAPAVPTSNQ